MATIGRGPERVVPHTGTGDTDQTPTGGSSEEYWSMGESLNQPCRVQEECPMDCKLLLFGNKPFYV
tara:strand:- start:65 stop:262 length:198 start_codon:yes stop_codon:yes gene_type:complete